METITFYNFDFGQFVDEEETSVYTDEHEDVEKIERIIRESAQFI